jgi:hypothetical protein
MTSDTETRRKLASLAAIGAPVVLDPHEALAIAEDLERLRGYERGIDELVARYQCHDAVPG